MTEYVCDACGKEVTCDGCEPDGWDLRPYAVLCPSHAHLTHDQLRDIELYSGPPSGTPRATPTTERPGGMS